MSFNTVRVLLLEDDLETVSNLSGAIAKLEQNLGRDISLVVLSEYSMVEEYINPDKRHDFDVILLDRDCKMGGSFHALDFEKFGVDKIIAISSTPQWNDEAQARGVDRVVWKDYENLDQFATKVIEQVQELLKR